VVVRWVVCSCRWFVVGLSVLFPLVVVVGFCALGWGGGVCNNVPCTCKHVSCYAMTSSLALANMFHATLWHLVLHLHPGFILRYDIFSCTCSQVSCYAMTSSLALANWFHARLWSFQVCRGISFRKEIHDCKCLYHLIRRHDVSPE